MLVHKSAWYDRNGDLHPESTYELGESRWRQRDKEPEFIPRSSGPKSVPKHPRAADASVIACCRKCKMILTLDANKNGLPNGYKLELYKGIWMRHDGVLIHAKHICGGEIALFKGSLPGGKVVIY